MGHVNYFGLDFQVLWSRAAFIGFLIFPQNSSTLIIVVFIPQTTRIFKSSGDRPDVPNVALFLWDGNTNVRPELLTPAAIAAHNQSIHIIAFGVGTHVDIFEMRNVASEPKNDNIFIAYSQRNLSSILSGMVKATCDSKYYSR